MNPHSEQRFVTHARPIHQLRDASVNQQRESNDAAINDLQRSVADASNDLKPIAEKNLLLARERQKLVAEIADATESMSDLKEKRTEVEAAQVSSENRLEAVGLTQAMGQLLRSKRDEYRKLRRKVGLSHSMNETTAEYQVAAFRLEDWLTELNERLDSKLSDDDSAERALLSVQRDQIQETLQTQNSLLQTLLSMETEHRQLQQSIDEYIAFVDKNVFWIRSAAPVSIREVYEIPQATKWLLGSIIISGTSDTLFTRGLGYALIYVALFTSSRHLLSQTCRDGIPVAAPEPGQVSS